MQKPVFTNHPETPDFATDRSQRQSVCRSRKSTLKTKTICQTISSSVPDVLVVVLLLNTLPVILPPPGFAQWTNLFSLTREPLQPTASESAPPVGEVFPCSWTNTEVSGLGLRSVNRISAAGRRSDDGSPDEACLEWLTTIKIASAVAVANCLLGILAASVFRMRFFPASCAISLLLTNFSRIWAVTGDFRPLNTKANFTIASCRI